MRRRDRIDLYGLLPEHYRIVDAETSRQLEALLAVIGEQVDILRDDIDSLWDDMSIETCADWVIPYIGDLVGNDPIHDVAIRRRSEVARTINYRRRKGTLPVIESIARDVTDWESHVVDMFQLLLWTQNLNHLRLEQAANPDLRNPSSTDKVGTVNLRSIDVLDKLDGPFDEIAHTVDVRCMDTARGRHNIPNVGIFQWRLSHYPILRVNARPFTTAADEYRFHFSPLGNPFPLFTRARGVRDENDLTMELNVPGPIRPLGFHQDLHRARKRVIEERLDPDCTIYGESVRVGIRKENGNISWIPPKAVLSMNLGRWPRPPNRIEVELSHGNLKKINIKAAVDVCRGRVCFAEGKGPKAGEIVLVNYCYAFSGDMGGGTYSRVIKIEQLERRPKIFYVWKRGDVRTLSEALDQWNHHVEGGDPPIGAIRVRDNASYLEDSDLLVDVPAGGWLSIEAANGKRPHIRPPPGRHMSIKGEKGSKISLNGLMIEGCIEIIDSPQVTIEHCTLVPAYGFDDQGRPTDRDNASIRATDEKHHPTVTVRRSILGPVRMHAECGILEISDSIIDVPGGEDTERHAISWDDGGCGPVTRILGSTLMGPVRVRTVKMASDTIFGGTVIAERTQEGCVRFSYVPPGSETPKRYYCQPDLALQGISCQDLRGHIERRVRPSFIARGYGHPAYMQLSTYCAPEILTGAEDGSQMGAFCHLKYSQRTTNLRMRLDEYLPFGRDGGQIFIT